MTDTNLIRAFFFMITFIQNIPPLKRLLYTATAVVVFILVGMSFMKKGPLISEDQPKLQNSSSHSYHETCGSVEITNNHEISDEAIVPISSSDVTRVSDSITAQDIHQKLAITLITELELLNLKWFNKTEPEVY